jgi:hypothetical protein
MGHCYITLWSVQLYPSMIIYAPPCQQNIIKEEKNHNAWQFKFWKIQILIFKEIFLKSLILIPQNRYSTPRGWIVDVNAIVHPHL